VFEGVGLRQLHNVYRIWGVVEYFQGKRGWGVMTRVGTGPEPKQTIKPAAKPVV
jgi:hypothetical protein